MSKQISELTFKDDLRYAKSHEWVGKSGETVKIGITDYAQDQLGDIVFVELPEVDDELDAGEELGTVESTKAVSEIYMPLAGRVVAVNEALAEAPELVNNAPYDGGWMVELAPSDQAEADRLMDKDAYIEMLKGL